MHKSLRHDQLFCSFAHIGERHTPLKGHPYLVEKQYERIAELAHTKPSSANVDTVGEKMHIIERKTRVYHNQGCRGGGLRGLIPPT